MSIRIEKWDNNENSTKFENATVLFLVSLQNKRCYTNSFEDPNIW